MLKKKRDFFYLRDFFAEGELRNATFGAGVFDFLIFFFFEGNL